MGSVLEEATDWQETAELVTDSYCLLAPRKLAGLVDRPNPAGPEVEVTIMGS